MNLSNRTLLFQLMNKVLVISFFIISLTMVLLLWFFKEFLIKLNCGFSLDYVTTILDSIPIQKPNRIGNGYFGEISVTERYRSLKWKATYRIGVHTIV